MSCYKCRKDYHMHNGRNVLYKCPCDCHDDIDDNDRTELYRSRGIND